MESRTIIRNIGGIEVIIKTINVHIGNDSISNNGCAILWILFKDDCKIVINTSKL